MMKRLSTLLLLITISIVISAQNSINFHKPQLIAHRGGVVDYNTPENSKKALIKAVCEEFWMVEVDVRATKDNVLITHHDKDFKRYFNFDKNVSETLWEEVSKLESEQGTKIQKLEDVLALCSILNINVMLDMKLKGFNENLCQSIVKMLNKYDLRENTLMIGSTATTEFFTGKVRLSCTRNKLEENMKRSDYNPDNYYFFGNPSIEDYKWAKKNNIMVVGVINSWAIDSEKEEEIVKRIVQKLKEQNIEYVQIDSKYAEYFKNHNND